MKIIDRLKQAIGEQTTAAPVAPKSRTSLEIMRAQKAEMETSLARLKREYREISREIEAAEFRERASKSLEEMPEYQRQVLAETLLQKLEPSGVPSSETFGKL